MCIYTVHIEAYCCVAERLAERGALKLELVARVLSWEKMMKYTN